METATRKHLTPTECDSLIEAAGKIGRHRHRDATMLLLAYRHGLRVSELVSLQWHQVSLDEAVLHVSRLKNGTPATHPLSGVELRALRRLQRECPSASAAKRGCSAGASAFVFLSERGAPLSADAVQKIIARAGVKARLPLTIHPHMLRHSAGYALAARGTDLRTIQAYLGHKNVSNTVQYVALSPAVFRGLWRD